MIKFFIRFLLSICILFSGGYLPLSAKVYRTAAASAQVNNRTDEAGTCSLSETNYETRFSSSGSHNKEEKYKILIEENEEEVEDKQVSLKKPRFSVDHFYTAIVHCALISGDLFSYSKSILSFCKNFSYTSSPRYLLLQVFRL